MLGRVSDAAVGPRNPVCEVGPGVRRAEGAPSNPENVTKDTPLGLDTGLRLCEDGYIDEDERKESR